mmetsp:Transcript_19810/g.21537  ORF Transcript_19810/g.21537 Transcript_19810/m.21537 type:complete len:240 (-) Transcript_19810:890-1609(-)
MDESDLGAIGFMFDASHEKVVFDVNLNNGYQISLKTIGDTPGHKQSGQYLWPAAEIAANHFIANWPTLRSERVLELGAGCGLAGLLISQLPDVKEVVFTDYDYGTLTLIEESIQLNQVHNTNGNSMHQVVDFLEWGNFQFDPAKRICEIPWMNEKFKLIVGTDLIYSKDVVEPLFRTASYFLEQNGKFVLTSSFPLGQDIESLVEESCRKLGLIITIVEHVVDGRYYKIQYFSRRSDSF